MSLIGSVTPFLVRSAGWKDRINASRERMAVRDERRTF
jgi:hypothetical protein